LIPLSIFERFTEEASESGDPFSVEALRAMEHAIAEADNVNHEKIRPEHLVLGVLVQTSGVRDILTQQGVTAAAIRAFLEGR
jgi:ATP-dependent Clp protease ATP-binding subunit ClpA